MLTKFHQSKQQKCFLIWAERNLQDVHNADFWQVCQQEGKQKKPHFKQQKCKRQPNNKPQQHFLSPKVPQTEAQGEGR